MLAITRGCDTESENESSLIHNFVFLCQKKVALYMYVIVVFLVSIINWLLKKLAAHLTL